MPFGGRLAWARVITWGCTLAPPGEYDWLIFATAAMRAAVTITVTVCCYCRRRVVIRYISVIDNNNNTINNTSRCFSRFKCWLRQRLQRGRRWLAKVAAHIRPARLIGSRLHHTKSETPLSVAPMFKKLQATMPVETHHSVTRLAPGLPSFEGWGSPVTRPYRLRA